MPNETNGQVFVAWLHPQRVEAVFMESMLAMLAYDFLRQNEGKPRQISGLLGYEAGVNISTPRNEVVREFLAHPERGDWLLSIDVDMQFPPDAVERLLEHADPEKAPIVGGLCFGTHRDGKLWPTLYELTELEEGPCFVRYTQFPLDPPLLRVGGTGAAFLMVHRRVFEAVRDWRGANGKPFSEHYPWFQETELSAGPLGEDLTFCLRAGICGFPVHVLTSLHIGHLKPAGLTAYRYFQQEGLVVDPSPDEPEPPKSPASGKVAITAVPS